MKELIESSKIIIEQKVGTLDPDSSDPTNPDIFIRGYARVSVEGLKKDLARKFKDLAERTSKGDFSQAQYQVNDKGGILGHLLQALTDAEEAMNSPAWKRKITNWKKKR